MRWLSYCRVERFIKGLDHRGDCAGVWRGVKVVLVPSAYELNVYDMMIHYFLTVWRSGNRLAGSGDGGYTLECREKKQSQLVHRSFPSARFTVCTSGSGLKQHDVWRTAGKGSNTAQSSVSKLSGALCAFNTEQNYLDFLILLMSCYSLYINFSGKNHKWHQIECQ